MTQDLDSPGPVTSPAASRLLVSTGWAIPGDDLIVPGAADRPVSLDIALNTYASDRLSLGSAIPGLDVVPVIGILRGCPPGRAPSVAAAAADQGLRVVEVTLDSSEPLGQVKAIDRLNRLTVGVGSVLEKEQVHHAVTAGARFVVCPTVDIEVIGACTDLGVPCIPGAATPTEIITAMRAGATAVKVFPAAQLGGPGYISAISAPLRHPPLVPTGGISADQAAEYLAAGASAIGAGITLFPPAALDTSNLDVVTDLARRWVEAVG